jgi:hypothetical protein
MTVSDLLQQPCNKSDNINKVVTSCQQLVPNLCDKQCEHNLLRLAIRCEIFAYVEMNMSILYVCDNFFSRLHEVRRLNKTPALTCISLHGSKLLFMFTSLNAKPKLEALPSSLVVCGGFCLCGILMNALLFEHEKHLDRNKVKLSLITGIRWRARQSLSPLRSWVRFSLRTHVKRVGQRSAESRGFSPGAQVSSQWGVS